MNDMLGPSSLLECPDAVAVNLGVNFRFEHAAAWKRELTLALAPWLPVRVLEITDGSQLVGFKMKPGRVMYTRMSRTCVGIPSMINGSGSVGDGSTLAWAVRGLMRSANRSTPVPKSNGPPTAVVTLTTENGSPSYGPARYSLPGA